MRILYALAWLLALPLAFLYLLWRSRRQPEYRRHWGERLGWAPRPRSRPLIWIHAVSVGETRAAAPVISALQQRYPDHALLLTHATPTGRDTGRTLFGDRVQQAYLPYDFPLCTALFLHRTRPVLGLVMETELWPGLFRACRGRDIPVVLVNARLSERSARGYQRFARLTAQALRDLSAIAAQTEADARRLRDLGAPDVTVTGNVKFDMTPPADTADKAAALKALFAGRFVFLCASTREGEEAPLLDAMTSLDLPRLLIVIVPRHPQRFDEVAGLLQARGLNFVRRSSGLVAEPNTRVFLGDSMGEMAAYYAAADLCYVGGSLVPLGGQNMIEAAALGCPALIGPHTWNFLEAAEQAVAWGAARRVEDYAQLQAALQALYADDSARQRMAQAGRAFTQANQGATDRVMERVGEALAG
ncbi:MAG: lipid IV(A) 3-deoxy-D-manno-octulosonic acid transferase [Pseudomonadota bacterium]